MTTTSNAGAASRGPTRGEAALQEFTNTNFTPRLLTQRATQLLKSKQLLRNVLGLALEDQTEFVEKVDQVGRDGSFFSPENFPPFPLQRHIRPSTPKT